MVDGAVRKNPVLVNSEGFGVTPVFVTQAATKLGPPPPNFRAVLPGLLSALRTNPSLNARGLDEGSVVH